jgi:hypothetical protein
MSEMVFGIRKNSRKSSSLALLLQLDTQNNLAKDFCIVKKN